MILLAVAIGIMTAFTMCKKDRDDNNKPSGGGGGGPAAKVTASNVQNTNPDIKTARAYIDEYEIAKANYSNGFTLDLPALESKYLAPVLDGSEEGYTITGNKNAKMAMIDPFYGCNASGDALGYFFYMGTAGEYHLSIAFWFYVDSDINVKGKEEWEEEGYDVTFEIDMKLKKGWNMVYVTGEIDFDSLTGKETMTTQKPSGLTFMWFFGGDNPFSSPSKITKFALKHNSLITKLTKGL